MCHMAYICNWYAYLFVTLFKGVTKRLESIMRVSR